MNKVYSFAVATMFVATSALPVLAIEPVEQTGGVPSTHEQNAPDMQRPAPGTGQPGQPAPMMKQSAEDSSSQRLTGTVTDVNKRTGFVTLATADGALKLHYPPRSVQNLKKGDTITAQFAFAKADIPGASTRAYDVPKGLGEHRMTGTVSGVDHTKGWLQVKTQDGKLQLHFPPQMVRGLKKGDRITVDLAFSKSS